MSRRGFTGGMFAVLTTAIAARFSGNKTDAVSATSPITTRPESPRTVDCTAFTSNPYSAGKYGRIRWGDAIERRHNVRCWLNGVEVTNRCGDANDREGWAMLLRQDSTGALLDTLDRHTGDVRFEVTRIAST